MIFLEKAKTYADAIKLAHTLFALPFALSAAALAAGRGAEISAGVLIWIVVAFTAARSAAMGFNRIADADIDALNPRTAARPTATGKLPLKDAKIFTAVSAAIFVGAAFMINGLCGVLSLPALGVLFGYSLAKRFTCLTHYILGCALSLAPIGAWIAATGGFDPKILLLGACLLFGIAGFDLIYSLQDMEFDRAHRLYSIPSRFGRKATLAVAGCSFAVSACALLGTGVAFGLNGWFFAAAAAVSTLYLAGLATIAAAGMAKVNLVFFYANVSVSFLILAGSLANAGF